MHESNGSMHLADPCACADEDPKRRCCVTEGQTKIQSLAPATRAHPFLHVSTNPLFCWSPTEGPSELFLSFLKLQLCFEPNVESRSQRENAGSHLGRLSTFSIDK